MYEKVQVAKTDICKPKIQQKSNVSVQSAVLGANARHQSWSPLIDGLVDDAVLQISSDRDDALQYKLSRTLSPAISYAG